MAEMIRVAGGVAGMLAGGIFLSGVLLVMNAKSHRPRETRSELMADIQVDRKQKPPPKPKRVKKKSRPKPTRTPQAPRPMLATDVSGLAVGLPMFEVGDLSSMGTDLLADQKMSRDMVMTESAVDGPPKPLSAPAPAYPARARARAIEGFVKVRLLIGEDGSVRKVSILEAEPEGVFEDAVLAVARSWRFEPATYQGQPVALAVNRKLTFKLD